MYSSWVEQNEIYSNYLSSNPSIMAVSHRAEIWYESLFPGVSIRFYSTSTALKHEFHLDPYVNPNIIQITLTSCQPIDVTIVPSHVRCFSLTGSDLLLWEDRAVYTFIR